PPPRSRHQLPRTDCPQTVHPPAADPGGSRGARQVRPPDDGRGASRAGPADEDRSRRTPPHCTPAQRPLAQSPSSSANPRDEALTPTYSVSSNLVQSPGGGYVSEASEQPAGTRGADHAV